MHTPRRRAFSQLKTAPLFPGSLTKTIEETLVRVYAGSSVLSCTTRSGEHVGLLFGEGVSSAGNPSPRAFGPRYLVYCYGNGICLETSSAEFAPRSRTFHRTCGKRIYTLMKAPEPTAGIMRECDDHATDQCSLSFQADPSLTVGMKMGSIHGERPGW